MRFTSHSFEVEAPEPFNIHPPYLYNSIKTEAIRRDDIDVEGPDDFDKVVLDAEWWRHGRTHTFTVTTQRLDYSLEDIVHGATENTWDEMFGTGAVVKSYGMKEIRPMETEVPKDTDMVLIETGSPVQFSIRDGDERRYAEPYDMGSFSKITLQLIRRYKELYGLLDDEEYRQVQKFSKQPENVMYYFEYLDDVPLRKDGSLEAKKAMEGKTLFRSGEWNNIVLKLLKLGQVMHLGQKTGYGLGRINVTFLNQRNAP